MKTPAAPAPASGKGRRRLLFSLLGLLAVFVLLLAVISIIFSTVPGSRWAVTRVSGLVSNEESSLQIGRIDGTLLWGLRLSDIRYQNNENTVTIALLSSRWDLLPLLYRQFNLESLHITGLQANWQPPAESPEESDPFAFLPLPVAIRLNDVQLNDSLIIYDGAEYPAESLQFNAVLGGHTLELEDLALQSAAIGEGMLSIEADLEVQLNAGLPMDGRVGWQYQGPLYEQIDAASGELLASGTIDALTIEHQLESPVLLRSTGQLRTGLTDPDTGIETALSFDLTHTLQQQALPVEAVRDLQFDGFTIQTSGTPDAVRISGGGAISGPSLPAVDLNILTQLRGSLLFIESVTLDTETGGITGNGLINWESGLAVDFDYTLTEDNPASWYAGMPEGLRLSGLASSGNVRLRTENEVLSGSASIDTLNGVLNEYELSGGGQLLINGDQLSIPEFSLSSSDNSISLSGEVGETINLDFAVDLPLLEHLYQDAQGSVTASGTVSGSREAPLVTVEGTMRNLVAGSAGVSDINLQAAYSPERSELQLQLTDASLGLEENSIQLHRLSAELSGRPDDHQLQLDVSSNYGTAAIRISGSLVEETWNGNLQSGSLDSLAGAWQLQQAVDILLSREHISLQHHCWLQRGGPGGSLCLEGDWTPQQIAGLAELSDYPLAVLNTADAARAIGGMLPGQAPPSFPDLALPLQLPPNLAIDTLFNGTVQLSGALTEDPQDLQVQAQLATGPGNLFVYIESLADTEQPDDEAVPPEPMAALEQFSWPGITMQLSRDNNNWNATASLAFAQQNIDGTGIGMQGSASAGARMDADRNIDGNIDLAFDDLNFIEAFLPQLQGTQGRLNSNIRLAGTLEQPQFGGSLLLEDTQTDIPELGLQLRGLQASLRSDDGTSLTLTGQVESGEGSLRFDSTLINPMQDSRELSLSIDGNSFQLANLPQMLLSVSPDLEVAASSNGIVVNGDLLIPELNIEIESLPESAVNVSGDAVIVGAPEQTEVRNAALGDRGILGDTPISGTVQLELGDDVRFTGFGLTVQIDGSLDINQRPTGSPLTYGELSIVEGSYTTYGQTLNIEHGKLLFFGTYDNPGLDIRAVREAENVKVGVQMNGTLRNIESQLFSTPPLPDGEIIAVLVTGRPLSEIGDQDGNALVGAITTLGINQGQSLTNQIRNQLGLDTLTIASRGDTSDSSVMLGKYLTPRIFIRYAVGLFETQSELAIEYSISDRVKLEATSGQDQSIDLTYTRER